MTAAMEMIYVADPMCSWCYGFAPVISSLAKRFEDELPLRLMLGGLRAGNTEPMGAADKDYVREAWIRVGAATGQPFDMGFFERENFNYDTEPACRAVVTVRRLQPNFALAFMARLQQAFYAENRDMTSATEICCVAEEAGLSRQAFAEAFVAPAMRNETFGDFLAAQELGIRGFPTLIAGSLAKGYALVTNGYRPLEDLLAPLERWLAAGAPVTASAQGGTNA
ncbi:MAG TPA: DsbA family protein [Hyphomicrobiaceae bacterium]|nr:DsbA family protein [Hyphomicrobiaceae bacterium]